jgi:hypothetical protein
MEGRKEGRKKGRKEAAVHMAEVPATPEAEAGV